MKIFKPNFRIDRRPRAQTMVEFALALPVFLLLVLGVIEFGRLLVSFSAVYTASREAARYGAAVGTSGNGVPYYMDCQGMRDAAARVGFLGGVTSSSVKITYDHGPTSDYVWGTMNNNCPQTPSLGDRVVVGVQATFQPSVPLVNIPALPISSITARTILMNVDIEGTALPSPLPRPTKTSTVGPSQTSTLVIPPTSTFTSAPTNTPTVGPSPTFTDTPTITNTPTSTDIPTITSTPSCPTLSGTAGSVSEFTLTLDNRKGEATSLVSVAMTWSKNKKWTSLKLSGKILYSDSNGVASGSELSSWDSATGAVDTTSSQTLYFGFSGKTESHAITAKFANGCTVYFP